MALGLDETRYARAIREGIPYSIDVPVTAPARFVKVLVYDYDVDRLGTTQVAVALARTNLALGAPHWAGR
jgi:hypothetical protein